MAVRVRGLLRRLWRVQLELKKGGATSKDCSWGLTITADGSLLALLSFLELFHSQSKPLVPLRRKEAPVRRQVRGHTGAAHQGDHKPEPQGAGHQRVIDHCGISPHREKAVVVFGSVWWSRNFLFARLGPWETAHASKKFELPVPVSDRARAGRSESLA